MKKSVYISFNTVIFAILLSQSLLAQDIIALKKPLSIGVVELRDNDLYTTNGIYVTDELFEKIMEHYPEAKKLYKKSKRRYKLGRKIQKFGLYIPETIIYTYADKSRRKAVRKYNNSIEIERLPHERPVESLIFVQFH